MKTVLFFLFLEEHRPYFLLKKDKKGIGKNCFHCRHRNRNSRLPNIHNLNFELHAGNHVYCNPIVSPSNPS